MGQRYLIDTNVICDYIGELIPPSGMSFLDEVVNAFPNLSVITQIEVLSWKVDERTALNVQRFISDSYVLNITPHVIMHCVAIRKARKLKTPDAIIAATALADNLTLVTRNIADFGKVTGLDLVNPWEI